MKDFVLVMDKIYTKYKLGTKYILSEEAQSSYEEMVDSYAEYIKEKYAEEGKTLILNYFISIYIYIYHIKKPRMVF